MQIKVLQKTKTCYRIFSITDGDESWQKIEEFDSEFELIEDLTDAKKIKDAEDKKALVEVAIGFFTALVIGFTYVALSEGDRKKKKKKKD